MAIFASDVFSGTDGTDLTAHTPDVGGSWIKVTGITGVIKITNANQAKGDSGGDSLYYNDGTPASAEYDVEADISVVTEIDVVGVAGRVSTTEKTGYFLYFTNNDGSWHLSKYVAGVETSLGTFFTATGLAHIKLQIRTAAKKAFIDGVEQISSVDDTITSAGKSALYYSNSDWGFNTTGRPADSFVATDTGSSSGGLLGQGVM